MELSFDKPSETLKYLTSETIPYSEISAAAEKLSAQISEPHTNKDGRKFQPITQGILECFKRINNYKSSQWISVTKLEHELLENDKPIKFTRINSKGEICEYKIINFDRIDFSKPKEYADEYKVIKKPEIIVEEDSDNEYKKVFTLLMNGENVFLTGYAGTGKSYILNKLKEKLKKKLTITSTTGIAAVNVKGQTLHSWAGVGLCKNPVQKTIDKIRTRISTLKQILNCKILAIDEISMLNLETFEYIDEVLRGVREVNEPFGGIQVLFIGDFFQLPPVEDSSENTEYSLFDEETSFGLKRRYCFDSPLWEKFHLKNVILQKNYRQSEKDFIKALSDMRVNMLNEGDINLLKSRETTADTFETDILHIFSTNDEANKYNMAKFNMIDEPVHIFEATDAIYRGTKPVYTGFTEGEQYILDIFGKNCRAENKIALKKGAKVMLLVNMDFNKGLINGSCGKITDFNEDAITVKFDNGITTTVPKHTFEYYYHDRKTAERTQFPLRLAYGITIHKSQGMTLDKLVVDCSRIFERGQAYVAMSRVKTLNGLYLKSFSPEKVMVDGRVAEFYKTLEDVGEVEPNAQLIFDFEQEDKPPQKSSEEIRQAIIGCVKEFNGFYGKTGITKILKGSSTVKNSEHIGNVLSSEFFGLLKSVTRKEISAQTDELIEEKVFTVKRISYGRPILCINEV